MSGIREISRKIRRAEGFTLMPSDTLINLTWFVQIRAQPAAPGVFLEQKGWRRKGLIYVLKFVVVLKFGFC